MPQNKIQNLSERKIVEVKVFDNVPKISFNIHAWEQPGVGIFNTTNVSRFRRVYKTVNQADIEVPLFWAPPVHETENWVYGNY